MLEGITHVVAGNLVTLVLLAIAIRVAAWFARAPDGPQSGRGHGKALGGEAELFHRDYAGMHDSHFRAAA